ncbi:hypothetical protein TIFTF001_019105 [Ficus carica]|uniref:Uncharacterized protein n=1 Tax=Ficus carica TaxID=3494 RepID=A0AA88ACR3_FICCA|nr:hypothetical protein TIFTF001_019105 [Ficus carica]
MRHHRWPSSIQKRRKKRDRKTRRERDERDLTSAGDSSNLTSSALNRLVAGQEISALMSEEKERRSDIFTGGREKRSLMPRIDLHDY